MIQGTGAQQAWHLNVPFDLTCQFRSACEPMAVEELDPWCQGLYQAINLS